MEEMVNTQQEYTINILLLIVRQAKFSVKLE